MITKIMARYRCRSTPQNNAHTAVLSPLQKETKEVREVEKNTLWANFLLFFFKVPAKSLFDIY